MIGIKEVWAFLRNINARIIRLPASRGLRKCLISRIKFTTGTLIVSEFHLYCQASGTRGSDKKRKCFVTVLFMRKELIYLDEGLLVGLREKGRGSINENTLV